MDQAQQAAQRALESSRRVCGMYVKSTNEHAVMQELITQIERLAKILQSICETRDNFRSVSPGYMTAEEEEVFTKLNFCTMLLERIPEKVSKLRPRFLEHRAVDEFGRRILEMASMFPVSNGGTKLIAKALKVATAMPEGRLQGNDILKELQKEIDFAIEFALSASVNLTDFMRRSSRRANQGADNFSPQFTVFISHAGEDKETMAIPIWKRLHQNGISAFLDKKELRVGENANEGMEKAMSTAPIGLFLLSTEFAAKKWTMKELGKFLEREAEAKAYGGTTPLLIPVFYRMGLHGWEEQDLFRQNAFAKWGFMERMENGETSIKDVREKLRILSRHTGIVNVEEATNEDSAEMEGKRESLVGGIVDRVLEVVEGLQLEGTGAKGS